MTVDAAASRASAVMVLCSAHMGPPVARGSMMRPGAGSAAPVGGQLLGLSLV